MDSEEACDSSLLFLLLPSCMVAPIGKSANKLPFSFSSFSNSTTDSNFKNLLLAMPSESSIGMDIQSGRVLTNNSEVRGHNPLSSNYSSREPSIVSSGCSTPYHDQMDMDLDDAHVADNTDNGNPDLFYETEQEKALRIGEAANSLTNTRPPGINNEAAPSCDIYEDDIINVQLPYDPHTPTEPELWSGSFHPISLHGSIKHFASDTKSIKVTLNFLAKYIQGKQVDGNKVNDLSDFDGMGDAIWNFISSVYGSKWDSLFTDHKTTMLRTKISSKFTPRNPPTNGNSKKDTPKSTLVTINKALPPPPLPAKSKKEINVISKYFQTKKPENDKKNNGNSSSRSQANKSYAQASKTPTSTSDVLKIKETFPALNAKKIDQVNNIVNGKNQQKP